MLMRETCNFDEVTRILALVFSSRFDYFQVNYLIFPGTSGAPWADYLLCDKRVAPPDLAFAYPTTTANFNGEEEGKVGVCPEGLRRGGESISSEKLVYLPSSYQVRELEAAYIRARTEGVHLFRWSSRVHHAAFRAP